MRRKLLLNLLLFGTCCVIGLSLLVLGQDGITAVGHIGLVQDWSMRHAVFPRSGPPHVMMAAQHDPRAFYSWRAVGLEVMRSRRESEGDNEVFGQGRGPRNRTSVNHDWSITLGTAGTVEAMYPAKFTFDINATPSCANDFVVFPVNQAPNATHENIVAFNNLYSGNVNSSGICNRTITASDNGLAATVSWSYAVSSSIAAGVSTSPALSLDGNKVAFVESKSGSKPHFHVLAWKSGDGVNASNKQDTQSPKVLNTFTLSAPVAGSGTASDLAFGVSGGGSGDTLSSPFVDYGTDKAYVGDDKGKLVRIKDVFCAIVLNSSVVVNPDCNGAAPPAPSIDATWGTAGTVTVPCGSRLTGPVVDFMTGNVFVGCSNGKLYGFNSNGTALAAPPVAVGDGSASGGVVDPPIVDGANGFVYVVSGTDGADAVLMQMKTDLTSPLKATLGGAGGQNIHAGAFNDAYFSSPVSTNWLIYVQGYNGGATHVFLYGAAFDANRNLVTGNPANAMNIHSSIVECSPLTEILSSGTDRLFISLVSGTLDGFNINAFPTGTFATAAETGGTSGIIVDNVSPLGQASSIYFATLGGTHSAVKLTQSALQ